jgi:hypothetical protein
MAGTDGHHVKRGRVVVGRGEGFVAANSRQKEILPYSSHAHAWERTSPKLPRDRFSALPKMKPRKTLAEMPHRWKNQSNTHFDSLVPIIDYFFASSLSIVF